MSLSYFLRAVVAVSLCAPLIAAAQLEICQTHLHADRLTTGKSGNAFDCYREILSADSTNKTARDGLHAILARYEVLLETARARGADTETYQARQAQVAATLAALAEETPTQTLVEPKEKEPEETAPKKKEKDVLRDGGYGPEWVRLSAGMFSLGDVNGNHDARQVQRLEMAAFGISRYEVSVREYAHYAQAVGKALPPGNDKDDHPVVNIRWDEAHAYAEWLSAQTGQVYRLPREAEWEYAARGGSITQAWWLELELDQVCNSATHLGQTAPVGSLTANPFDLHDMAGNVWEWTCSEYNPTYADGKAQQCAADTPLNISVRGGGWDSGAAACSPTFRYFLPPASRHPALGFRLVREL
jgi:formylglycine-generating enzyme required for sulfatase activity